MAKVAKTFAVQIDAGVHGGLTTLATSMSDAQGKRVTVRSLVEEAVLTRWPDIRVSANVVSGSADGPNANAELFNRVLGAIYSSGDPAAQNVAIDALKGSVVGSYGQRVKLSALAYHLRGGANDLLGEVPIGSMDDLVKSYEASVSAPESEEGAN